MSHPSHKWLAPFYKHISLASFLAWQARFLTPVGARRLGLIVLQEYVDELTFESNNLHWTIPLQDANSIGGNLFVFGEYERAIVEHVMQWMDTFGYLNGDKIIFDLGANLGHTTLPLAQLTACRIVSVEPVPRNLDLLKRNLAQNRMTEQVTLVEAAITEQNGGTEIIVPLTARGGAEVVVPNVTRHEDIFRGPCETVRVRTTRLDQLLSELAVVPERVAFVWCDVQGSEGAVVRTGAPLWRAGVPLWMELAPELLRRQGTLEQFFSDAQTYFENFFTRLALLEKGARVPLEPIGKLRALADELERAAQQMDVLLVPRRG